MTYAQYSGDQWARYVVAGHIPVGGRIAAEGTVAEEQIGVQTAVVVGGTAPSEYERREGSESEGQRSHSLRPKSARSVGCLGIVEWLPMWPRDISSHRLETIELSQVDEYRGNIRVNQMSQLKAWRAWSLVRYRLS